ncbi:MAG TPA: VOC family protein [Edaphobacter sp.]
MAIEKIFAHVSCINLERSKQWYAQLFGRAADAEPMQQLAEWHHGSNAGMQLFEDAKSAGKSTLTLIVGALGEEHKRLQALGLNAGAIESGDTVSVLRMNDPDGNLVVLAQPGRA